MQISDGLARWCSRSVYKHASSWYTHLELHVGEKHSSPLGDCLPVAVFISAQQPHNSAVNKQAQPDIVVLALTQQNTTLLQMRLTCCSLARDFTYCLGKKKKKFQVVDNILCFLLLPFSFATALWGWLLADEQKQVPREHLISTLLVFWPAYSKNSFR